MAGIKEDLANKNFKNMYLIYGEEAYLRNYYRTSLRYALTEPDDNLNYSYFEGAGINLEEVVDILDTLPFMSEKRVVICENTGWLSKSDEGGGANLKMLITALDNLSEDVVFILCEEKVDKRSALYKKISTKGLAEEFARQTEESLIRYVINLAGAEKKKIAPNAAAYLVTETGNDMILLGLEVAKLVAYCLDRAEITIKDIDTVCTHQITGKIFDMIAAISARRQKEALRLYYDLLNLSRRYVAGVQAVMVDILLLSNHPISAERRCIASMMDRPIIQSMLRTWCIQKLCFLQMHRQNT